MPNDLKSPPEHSPDDFWHEINSTKSDVSALTSKVSSIDARLDGVENALTRIESHLSRPRSINWTGIGSLIIAVIAISATYIQARLNPIETALEKSFGFDDKVFDYLVEDSRERGKFEAITARNEKDLARLYDHSRQAAEDHATLERLAKDVDEHHAQGNHPFGVLSEVQELRGMMSLLREQVKSIDDQGSRRWNESRER